MIHLRSWIYRGLGLVLLAELLAGCGTDPTATPLPPPTATPAPPAAQAPSGAATSTAQYLVQATDLVKGLADPNLRIVDMGSAAEYQAGHIPGAVHIDWSELNVTDTGAASIAAWQDRVAGLLGQRGIGDQQRVVIYDHGTLYGARLWWVLDQLGHADKQILDGGFAAWQAAGGAVTQAAPTVAATTYAAHPQPAVLATEAEIRAGLGQADIRLVDARSPGEYSGADTSGAAQGGHIPGAVNVPFTTTATDGSPRLFQSPDHLRALFAAQGVTPDQPVITYCSTGVRGAVDYFALRLAGFDYVKLYTGSWAEWGNDSTAPVEK